MKNWISDWKIGIYILYGFETSMDYFVIITLETTPASDQSEL